MSDKITLQAYAFVLQPWDHLRIILTDMPYNETAFAWDRIQGFIGIVHTPLCSFHLFLTPEGRDKGAEMARAEGFDPLRMDEPLPVDEDMIKKFREAAETE